MAELPRRITGTEMEWPIYSYDTETRKKHVISANQLSPHLESYLASSGLSKTCKRKMTNTFLVNGGRCYSDVGEKREYDTPEDDSFIGTVASEIAGERIMAAGIETDIESNDGNRRSLKNAYLYKRVVGLAGDSDTWGYHQNYLAHTDLQIKPEDSPSVSFISGANLALLGIHLATRNIYAGAGSIGLNGNYRIAQKALGIKHDISAGTMGDSKPVINTRDEPHADTEHFRRVHVTSGDANMSPWAMRMSLGTTSLVLRIIEQDYKLADLSLSSTRAVMGAVATDPLLKNKYHLANGDRLSAVDIQRRLLSASQDLARNNTLPSEELWTLDEWNKTLADLEQNPKLLLNKADWVTKQHYMNLQRERSGCSATDPRLQVIDLLYEEIGPRGLGLRLRQDEMSEYMPSEDLINIRMKYPPSTTRAWIRGSTLRHHADIVTGVNWGNISINGSMIPLNNPYATHSTALYEAIAKERQREREEEQAN